MLEQKNSEYQLFDKMSNELEPDVVNLIIHTYKYNKVVSDVVDENCGVAAITEMFYGSNRSI